jgi:hypothetical protein
MALRHRLSAAARPLVFALFACALLVRALVPAGWMPGDSAHAGTLQLCFDAGAPDAATLAKITAELAAHKLPVDKHDGDKSQHCDFAASAHALLTPAQAPQIAMPEMAEAPALMASLQLAPGRGLAAPPPPATGPPLHA